MITAEAVKTKLQGLIGKANDVTGNSDATLSAAVESLIAGFGQGGQGMTIQTGSFTPAENLDAITLPVSGTPTNLVPWRTNPELIPNLRLLHRYVVLDLTPIGMGQQYDTLATGPSGTGFSFTNRGEGVGTDSGIKTFDFTEQGLNIRFYAALSGWGVLSAGDEYRWLAW